MRPPVHKPGDTLHKVSRHADMAICGAKRGPGVAFAWNFRALTCAECIRIMRERRAAAKARFAAEVGR